MNKVTDHLVFDHSFDPLIHGADEDGAIKAHTESHDEDGDVEHVEIDGRILHIPRVCRHCSQHITVAYAPDGTEAHWVHLNGPRRRWCSLPPPMATPW